MVIMDNKTLVILCGFMFLSCKVMAHSWDTNVGCTLCWTRTFYTFHMLSCPWMHTCPHVSYVTAFSLKASHDLEEKCSDEMNHRVNVSEGAMMSTQGEWKNNPRATPSSSPSPLQRWGFILDGLTSSSQPRWLIVCLAGTFLHWNVQGHTEITESPQTSAKKFPLDICDVNVVCASVVLWSFKVQS